MSIINEAIKKARKEFEVKKDPVINVSGVQENALPEIQTQAPEAKWTTLVAVSLVVIVSLLGSLFLYRHISKINAGYKYPSTATRPGKGANAPISRMAKNTYAPMDIRDTVILNGIVHGPKEKWAIINDNIVREGETIAAGEVISIEEGFVEILQESGEKLVLELK
ncbi:MAG: hypothetical protein KKG21_01800 [Candidatus Omnitrophica bacterium]|nr:hypothetical protein [Candidatus Omnitrophota bacterium]